MIIHRAEWAIAGVLVFVLLILIGFFRFDPGVDGFRPPSVCRSNLRAIGLALHRYHDDYGAFPPAVLTDEDGEPLHSWRVLVLPYLRDYHSRSASRFSGLRNSHGIWEARRVYEHKQTALRRSEQIETMLERYRFDEPWDGPHNRMLHDLPMEAFRNNSQLGKMWQTTFVAVTGSTTAWQGDSGVSIPLFRDGRSVSALVVEMADSGIHWLEPRDLRFDEMSFKIGAADQPCISSPYPDGAHCLFADGSVRFVNSDISAETVKSLLEIDDGGPGFTDF